MAATVSFFGAVSPFDSIALAANHSGIIYKRSDGGSPGVLAKVEGQEISLSDIEKTNPSVVAARLEYYKVQRSALDETVRNKVLERLAKKEGLSLDEFLKKEMIGAKTKVSDKEVNEYLASRSIGAGEKVTPKLRDQVRGLVHARNLVAASTGGKPVELYLKRPRMVSRDPAVDSSSPIHGSSDAQNTLYEYVDFQCDFCAKARSRVAELKKLYGQNLRIVIKNLPLSVHPFARPAAEAGMCVHDQGGELFWKFYNLAFDNQKSLTKESLAGYATKAGADAMRFKECVESKKFAKKIDADLAEAERLGIDSTPTYILKGQIIRGAQPLSDFREIIEDAGI
jgi:protein-disulfide isomerase